MKGGGGAVWPWKNSPPSQTQQQGGRPVVSSAAVCPACPAQLQPAVPQLPGPPVDPASDAHLALCIRHELDVEHYLLGGALPARRGLASWCRRSTRLGSGTAAIGRLAPAADALQLHGSRLAPHCESRRAAQVAQRAGARALRTAGRRCLPRAFPADVARSKSLDAVGDSWVCCPLRAC